MFERRQKTLIPFRSYLEPEEEILFHKESSRFLGKSKHWILTNKHLFVANEREWEEKILYAPGEYAIYHETGELEFSGNIHLLTNQRVLILNIGARDHILASIPLFDITRVDIRGILGGEWIKSIVYGLLIYVTGVDEPFVIKQGGVTTNGIDQEEMDLNKRQEVNERFPRKICDVTGLKFATPRMWVGEGGNMVIEFYSKSDLVWPERCSACYEDANGLVYDRYTIGNPWLASGYHLGYGLIPKFAYQIPYCSACYDERFGIEIQKRAVSQGFSQSDGARVELFFENGSYAMEFIHNNSA